MPYEKINHGEPVKYTADGFRTELAPTGAQDVAAEGTDPELIVNWVKKGFVQIGLDVDLPQLRNTLLIAEAAQADRQMVWTNALNREDLNRFIRVLRDVRNQVFGSDE